MLVSSCKNVLLFFIRVVECLVRLRMFVLRLSSIEQLQGRTNMFSNLGRGWYNTWNKRIVWIAAKNRCDCVFLWKCLLFSPSKQSTIRIPWFMYTYLYLILCIHPFFYFFYRWEVGRRDVIQWYYMYFGRVLKTFVNTKRHTPKYLRITLNWMNAIQSSVNTFFSSTPPSYALSRS